MKSKPKSEVVTQAKLSDYEYEGGWDVRWDSKTKGFGVRLYPGGAKSFILRYRKDGITKTMVIGPVGPLTVKQARDRAKKYLASVIDAGDPPS